MTAARLSLLNHPLLHRIRRNHGLEHATIHVLSARRPRVSLVGRSDHRGFVLIGDVATEAVREAAETALRRMKAGEHSLAVHPNCGTIFVTMGAVVSLVAVLGSLGLGRTWRTRLERLPLLISAVTMALILSQPLGLAIQREITTTGDMGALEIVSITRQRVGLWTLHRVETVG